MLSLPAKERLGATSRVLLGVALLVPGWQKVGDPFEFARVLDNYALLGPKLVTPAAAVIPWLEMAVGICLLLGVFSRAAAILGLGLALTFGAFVGSALARGLNIECGCFSGASTVSYAHLGLDGLLLLLALATLIVGPDRWSMDRRLDTRIDPGKKALVGAATVGLLVLALWATSLDSSAPTLAAASSSAPPTLAFEPAQLKLGPVAPDQTVEKSVLYRNTGSETLDIIWVQSSCQCTVAQPEKRKLAPGEAGELKVQYHLSPGRKPTAQNIKVYQKGHRPPAILEVIVGPSVGHERREPPRSHDRSSGILKIPDS